MGPSQVEETVVESGIQTHADGICDPQGKRRFSLCDHGDGGGEHLVRWWGRRFAFFGLGRALLSHRARHRQRAFAGQTLQKAQLFLAEGVGFGEHLGHTGAVTEVSEADCTLTTACMQKSSHRDFLADEIRAHPLDVAKGM